jgi:hypothetical protein
MKMIKNTKKIMITSIIFLIVIVVIVITLWNIPKNSEISKFYGEWLSKTGHFNYVFYSNGTCKIEDSWASWEINNGKITFEFFNENRINISDYFFSENDEILNIAGMDFFKQ